MGIDLAADIGTVMLAVATIRMLALVVYARLTFLLIRCGLSSIPLWWILGVLCVASVPVCLSLYLGEPERLLAMRSAVSAVFVVSVALASPLEFREQGVFFLGRCISWCHISRVDWCPPTQETHRVLRLKVEWSLPFSLCVPPTHHDAVSQVLGSARRFQSMPLTYFGYLALIEIVLVSLSYGILWCLWAYILQA